MGDPESSPLSAFSTVLPPLGLVVSCAHTALMIRHRSYSHCSYWWFESPGLGAGGGAAKTLLLERQWLVAPAAQDSCLLASPSVSLILLHASAPPLRAHAAAGSDVLGFSFDKD